MYTATPAVSAPAATSSSRAIRSECGVPTSITSFSFLPNIHVSIDESMRLEVTQTSSVRDDGLMRRKGVLIVLGGALLGAVGVVAFLAQRPAGVNPPPPYAVARAADVTTTPQAISVVMRRGFDRVLHREGSRLSCADGSMGCPGTTELRPTTVFLVRDEGGVPHAFIGEDPRNGCALEWKTLPPDYNWFIEGVRVDGGFYDLCHGSMYDRHGRVIAGPSPWDLNQLATEIRDADLYVDPGTILVGASRPPDMGR